MAETIPARWAIEFDDPRDGHAAVIYSCTGHMAATCREAMALGAVPGIAEADPARHGCKGHQEGWPLCSCPRGHPDG